jgi:nicotinamidase-related amidase
MTDEIARVKTEISGWTIVGKPALLIVNASNTIEKASGSSEAAGRDVSPHGGHRGVAAKTLASAFRNRGFPIIFIVSPGPSDVEFPVYRTLWAGTGRPEDDFAIPYEAEIAADLAPMPEELVFRNFPSNTNERTDFHRYLREQGVETVVLIKIAPEASVATAAWALAELGYNVIVSQDPSGSRSASAAEAIDDAILPTIGRVTTTQDIIGHL